MEFIAAAGWIVAGIAGGIAWGKHETIQHLNRTIDQMRGDRADGPQAKRITNGSFADART